MEKLPGPLLRQLKAKGQLLEPVLRIGKNGVSVGFIQSVRTALQDHELIKIKFDEFKDQKKTLAPQIAAQVDSHLVMQVGNVFVIYRPRPVNAA